MKCLYCQSETENPKFCSKSCAARVNNKVPKRKLTRQCLECDTVVSNYRKQRCDYHTELYKSNKIRCKTIGEYRNKLSVKGKHPSWVHAHIRGFARAWLKHLTKLPCRFCGYKEHVELAHIKAVSEFDDSDLLSAVNSESNVIQLCPNCHWEFDNKDRTLFTGCEV